MSDTHRSRTERFYRRLLLAYPADFRDRFASDLIDLFRDKHRVAREQGRLALLAFWIRIVSDVLVSAVAERLRARPARPLNIKGVLMDGLTQDVRYALRVMARRPALSFIIIATLALGIGANTAIFSVVNTVLLRPLPYAEPERLMGVRELQLSTGSGRPVRTGNFFEWRERARSFEDVAWSRDGIFNLTGEGEPESIIGYRFSANMFSVLGVQPALGRTFSADEDQPGATRVVVLSDKLWQRKFNADPQVLGRTIALNGQPHAIVGVMPPAFRHPTRAELWTPIALSPEQMANRRLAILRPVARLKPGVSHEQAESELATLYRDLAQRYPDTNAGLSIQTYRFGDTGDAKAMLTVLFVGVGFVLLIACANVANLLLADATSRRRELAVRSALGASRARVIRQMLTESVIMSLVGGALGALLTWWTRDALVSLFPANIANLNLPLVERIDITATVFVFAFVISILTGILFGLLPAWNVARANLQGALKDGGRTGSASRGAQGALVVAEVALSIVLLAGALLMVQSFVRLQRQQLGFDPSRVLSARVLLPTYRYSDDPRIAAFTRTLLEKLRAIPGVERAGITNYLPLSGWNAAVGFELEGQPAPEPGKEPIAAFETPTEDYFEAMGIRLLSGRTFTAGDDDSAPRVVVVNETFAKRFMAGRNPVGSRIALQEQSGRVPYQIVGMVADVRHAGFEEPIEPTTYFSYWQGADPTIGIAIRSSVDAASLASQVRAAVWSIDRDQPVTFVLTMEELAAESTAFRRVGMMLAGGFGILALLLAAIGLYGVLSYSVTRQTKEIGVRMALGASRGEVARLVVRNGIALTAIGIAIGIAGALALSKFLTSVLYEVRATDPLTYVAVGTILVVVALLATWIPARRATAIDPIIALRAE